jgi:hypothetical protein
MKFPCGICDFNGREGKILSGTGESGGKIKKNRRPGPFPTPISWNILTRRELSFIRSHDPTRFSAGHMENIPGKFWPGQP